jgi:hypothetical protein
LTQVGKGDLRLEFVGRPALPTPAMGLSKANTAQAQQLMKDLWERALP